MDKLLQERGRLSEEEARLVLVQLLDALKYLQQKNIIHRDIKPDNIVCQGPPDFKIKLIDFGLATVMKSPDDRKFATYGLIKYMAPEYWNKERGYGMEVDLWAVGITLYELLGGSFDTIRLLNPSR